MLQHFKTNVEDMEVYHPMRELLDNEIQYYMKFHGLTAADTYVQRRSPVSCQLLLCCIILWIVMCRGLVVRFLVNHVRILDT